MRGHIRRTGKDGKSHTVVLDIGRDANGKRQQRWKSFQTRKAAEQYLGDMLKAVHEGSYSEPTKDNVKDFMAKWLSAVKPRLKASTAESYETVIACYIVPSIGAKQVRQLTPPILQTFFGDLEKSGGKKGKRLSPRTVRYAATVLKKALNDAVAWGLLAKNPAHFVSGLPRQETRPMVTWTADELRCFLGHAQPDSLYAAFRLAASTGMRRSEICGLRWGDVDFDGGRLSIQRGIVSVRYKAVISDPKTTRSRRAVALDAATMAVLREHRVRQAEQRLVLGLGGASPDAAVFQEAEGNPVHPEALSARFESLVKSSGLPRLTLHGLRHSWATLALQGGVHPKVVSERLGHSNISLTLNVYSHVIPAMEAEAAEKVAALFT